MHNKTEIVKGNSLYTDAVQSESKGMPIELHEWAVASRNIKSETRLAKAEAMVTKVSSRVKFPYVSIQFSSKIDGMPNDSALFASPIDYNNALQAKAGGCRRKCST